jgi:hypothetical protein
MTGILEREKPVKDARPRGMQTARRMRAEGKLRTATGSEPFHVSTRIVSQRGGNERGAGEIKMLAWAGMGPFPDLHNVRDF